MLWVTCGNGGKPVDRSRALRQADWHEKITGYPQLWIRLFDGKFQNLERQTAEPENSLVNSPKWNKPAGHTEDDNTGVKYRRVVHAQQSKVPSNGMRKHDTADDLMTVGTIDRSHHRLLARRMAVAASIKSLAELRLDEEEVVVHGRVEQD